MGLSGTQNINYIDIGNATVYLAGIPVGSVKSGSFEGSYEKQEHSSGYPKITDKSVITGVKASFKGTWEEVRGENLRVALGAATTLSGFKRSQTTLTRTATTNGRFAVRMIGLGSSNKSYVGALPNPAVATGSDGAITTGALTTFVSAAANFVTAGVQAGDFLVLTGAQAGNQAVFKVASVTNATTLVVTANMAIETSVPYSVSQLGVYSTATGTTLYKPSVDFVYDATTGSIYAVDGTGAAPSSTSALENAQGSTGECTVYCEYTMVTGAYTRIPLGAIVEVLELPVLIEKVRSSDGKLLQIMFWKASPATSFSLPFNPDDWQSYEVELVSVKDTSHPNEPLGYIDIPSAA